MEPTAAFQHHDGIRLRHRAGSAGAVQPNAAFSIDWVGPYANLWIQNINVGQLAFTSDYRIKKGVAPCPRHGIA